MKREARCACRASAVTIEGELRVNGLCHCENCKRRTGSAFGWGVYVKDEQVGEPSGPPKRYDLSTREQSRWFCGVCGSTLFWRDARAAGMTGLAGGCFPPGALATPDLTINNETRCDWLALPESWRTHW